MESPYTCLSEEERAARRAQRAEARKKKRRAQRRRQLRLFLPVALLLVLVVLLSAWARQHRAEPVPVAEDPPVTVPAEPETPPEPEPFTAVETAETVHLDETFPSEYAVLIDVERGVILAEKGRDAVIAPASMTKLLTVLVAAEHVTEADLEETVSITRDIADYCFVHDCSVVGLEVGESVSVRELFYGTILSSGADASLALANYVAGSHEAFVTLMNEKLADLGLAQTAHFTNCVGLFEEGHACTVYDMAVILRAAMEDPLCRQVLSAHTYETAPTAEHPEGQVLSNWFLRRIEDKDTGTVEVTGAKTGYVAQSGSCAASCGEDAAGNAFLCVTAKAYSSQRCIYDHAALYKTYCG